MGQMHAGERRDIRQVLGLDRSAIRIASALLLLSVRISHAAERYGRRTRSALITAAALWLLAAPLPGCGGPDLVIYGTATTATPAPTETPTS